MQVRAAYLKKFKKWDADRLRDEFWEPHHTWAGHQFYTMAIDLRGFYLKVCTYGNFLSEARIIVTPGHDVYVVALHSETQDEQSELSFQMQQADVIPALADQASVL